MKSEYLAEFDQFSVDLDHSEATAINATFDAIQAQLGDKSSSLRLRSLTKPQRLLMKILLI